MIAAPHFTVIVISIKVVMMMKMTMYLMIIITTMVMVIIDKRKNEINIDNVSSNIITIVTIITATLLTDTSNHALIS